MASSLNERYGVIVCNKCGQAKGVELRFQTTKCPHCGNLIYVKNLKIMYLTNDKKKLQVAIAKINKLIMNK
jgi:hypothetical protein